MKTKEKHKTKQDSLLKRWYRLCQPSGKVWFLQIFFHIIYAALCACMTIFAAKTINYLYLGDWQNALIWLAVELGSILIREVCLYLHRAFFGKHYGIIKKNITRKIYDKILTVEEAGIKTFSSEKIINIAQNNLEYSCTLPEYFSDICRFMIEISIAIISIFTTNPIAGLVVLALGVVNYFFYNYMNKRLGKIMNDRFVKNDKSFQEYSKIILGKPVIEELEASDKFKNQLLDHVSDFNVSYAKYQRELSFRDSVHWALWNIVVYAVSAVLVIMISKNAFELSLYLIIVPYLKSCTEKLNDLYKKLGDFENVRVDVDRVNTILSLTDKQLLTYGDIRLGSNENGDLRLIDVYYESTNPELHMKDIDMNFAMNSVNIVKGGRGCGKRVVFDMLRRKVKPDRGKVLLNNLDLFDYSSKTFKNHIEYCAAHPIFISGTVKENLLLANSNFKQVQALIKELGLESKILSLEKGYETNIEDIKDGETKFWIGLIRAAVKESRILMIYEYPEDVSPDFHSTLKRIIATSEPKKRTLIFFTHKDDYDNLAEKLFEFKDGKLINK